MNLLTKNFEKLLPIFLLLIYLILNLNFLLFEPLVWPDESYIADVANNVTQNAGRGTNLWGNTIAGISKSLYWYPPIYINILAVWFKFFGLSIFSQRILSTIMGAALLVVLYLFIQRGAVIKKKKLAGAILMLGLIIDNTFLKSTRIGRPEILVVLLGFLSLFLYQLTKETKFKNIFSISAGIFSALAFLTHFIGIFFFLLILASLLIEKKFKIIKDRNSILFIFAFILPVLFWLASILPDLSAFLQQLFLQGSFRLVVPSYIEAIFKHSSIEQKTVYIIYVILSGISFINILTDRSVYSFYLLLGLFAGWLICLIGKLEWYPIYLISFLYPLVVINIFNSTSKNFSLVTKIFLVGLFLINVKMYFTSVNLYMDKKESYYVFGQNAKKIIPEGKTVYLSTTPDLYFLLRERNFLYEFPGFHPDQRAYLDLLNDSDYIIINFHLERLFVGNLLDRYIEYNKVKTHQVEDSQLYQAEIIELVPKGIRKLPNYD